MATFNSNVGRHETQLQLVVTPRPYDIPTNSTIVDWVLKVYTGSTFWEGQAQASNVYINGGSSLYTQSGDHKTTATRTWYTVASGYKSITHNTDGTKSINVSAQFSVNSGGYGPGNLQLSDSMTLPTIPRLSTPTLSSSSRPVGSSVTIYTNRASSSFTHKLYYRWGSGSWVLIASDIATSYAWTLPTNLLATGYSSRTLNFGLETYSGSTRIPGSTFINMTVTMPVSTFTIPSSFTMGSAFTVSINRNSISQLTHWVILYDGSTSLYSSGNTVGTSVSPNVALSTLAGRSPSAMSRSFTVQVDTYNGSTYIGRQTKNITGNVPSTVKPTFSAVTVSENVSSVASLVGAYVQTKSKLNLAITGASGTYGSTIRSYNITGVGHNVNASSTVTGLLSVSGNQTIKGTVTDSRGQTFDKSIVVNILPYTAPTLSDLSFRRTLPDKTEAPLGDNVTVRANVKVQSLIVNGVEKNSIRYNVQSARTGYSFADKANTTSTSLTENYSDVWSGYSVDYSYNFRVRTGDVFGWGSWSVGVVPTGIVTQQWGRATTSFGKMIDDTSYNVQVGTGGIQSDGPVIGKDGKEIESSSLYMQDARNYGDGSLEFDLTPNEVGDNRLRTDFAYIPNAGSAWRNSLTLKGWTDTYAAWQLIGPGSSTADDDLYFRSGQGSTWRNPKKVSFDGHTHSASNITSGTIADARLPAKSKPADYPIETGLNYTKWNSGKLEQRGRFATTSTNLTYAPFDFNFPIAFINDEWNGSPILVTTLDGQPGLVYQYNRRANGVSGYVVRLSVTAFTGTFAVDYNIVGRWK